MEPTGNNDRGKKRKAAEADLSEEDGPATVLKRLRYESEPLAGPSGITQTTTAALSEEAEEEDMEDEGNEEDEDNEEDVYDYLLNANLMAEEDNNEDADEAVQEPHPVALPAPGLFNIRYEVFWNELLARGENAWIYGGVRRIDGRQVAIKFVHVLEDRHDEERYGVPGVPSPVFREIGMMLEMQMEPPPCPNVVAMLDWFEGYPGYIIVMERLSEPWVRLDQFVNENHGMLSERVCRDLSRELLKTFIHFSNNRIDNPQINDHHIMVNRETLGLKVIDFRHSTRINMTDIEGHQICGGYHQKPQYQQATCHVFSQDLMQFWRLLEKTDYSIEFRSFYRLCRSWGCNALEDYFEHPWMTNDEWMYDHNESQQESD